MAITEQQRLARKNGIGSSDAPAIMGVDLHQTIGDIWLVKTGKATDFDGNDATDSGNDLESSLLNYAERKLGVRLDRNVNAAHPAHPELAANLDGLVAASKTPVEAKSTGVVDEWGEAEDAVPNRVNVQCHFQMACLGEKSIQCYVPRVSPGFKRFDWQLHIIERDNELAEMIVEGCLDFWWKYVQKDIRPDDFRPSLEVLKRVKREPNKIISLPAKAIEIVASLEAAKEAAKVAKADVEQRQAELIALLDDAEGGTLPDGRLATWMIQKRSGYVVSPTEFRQLKFKKA